MSFFSELKRRNVFKVGVAYAIVSWLLIQVASIIVPAYQAPGWVMPIFVTLISLGFPLALFLAWVYELTPEGIKVTTSEGPSQYHTRATGQRLNYFILGVLVLVVSFMLVDNYVLKVTPTSTVALSITGTHTTKSPETTKPAPSPVTPAPVAGPSRRTSLILGSTQPLSTGLNALVALSPDGLQLVYLVNTKAGPQLWHRNLLQLSSQPLPTPAGDIGDVFFSPDGQWVGVGVSNPGALYKVSVQGGQPQLLAKGFISIYGGQWAADGFIYFTVFDGNLKLYRVRDTGGKPEQIPVTGKLSKQFHSLPQLLPDGTHLLVTVSTLPVSTTGRIALLDIKTGASRILIQSASQARYVPTGHIVFMRSGSLWTVPFDVQHLRTTGPEVPVVNGVENAGIVGFAVYAFSNDGLLVYLPGGDLSAGASQRQLVWVNRKGNETSLKLQAANYHTPRLSPDEKQLAITIGAGIGSSTTTQSDIWTYDFSRGTLSRRTFSGNCGVPLWTPDGKRLVFRAGNLGENKGSIAWINEDGTGQQEQLIEGSRLFMPSTFSPDGSQLVYFDNPIGLPDIDVLSMKGKRTERPLIATKFDERFPAISPDGHWISYTSLETGQGEIYIRPFPDVNGGKWQISAEGGYESHWRSDGKKLYYLKRDENGKTSMMAVTINTGPHFTAGIPTVLFSGDYYTQDYPRFDVSADGQRFLMMKSVETNKKAEESSNRETTLVVVENWFAELKRLAPPAH